LLAKSSGRACPFLISWKQPAYPYSLLTNPPTGAMVGLVLAILLVDKVVCVETVVVAWLVDGPVEAR